MKQDVATVARSAEIATGERFLDDVATGPAGLLFLGEAGIGKTTLWSHVVRRADVLGYRVLESRPARPDQQLSFGVLADLLVTHGPPLFGELPPPQRRAIEVALLLAEAHGHPPDRRAIAAAVLGLLRLMASATPVVVAIDDLQWVDDPSWAVLDHALRRVGSDRIALLASVRTGEPTTPMVPGRGAPGDSLRRVEVGPLSVAELHHLIEARLERSFARPVLLRLREAARGNPFHALEIARAIRTRNFDLSRDGELPVPEDVRRLVAERMATLPKRTREHLLVVSASSKPSLDTLARLRTPGGSKQVATDLQPAVSAGILTLNDQRVSFAHPLFAGAVSSEAEPAALRAVHRRLAAIVADEEDRARHLAASVAGPNERAAAALESAAVLAWRRGAPEVAAEMCEWATKLTPRSRRTDRVRRTLAAGRHSFSAGDHAGARRLLDVAIAASHRGPVRAEALRLLAEVRYQEDSYSEAIDLLERAIAEAEDDHGIAAVAELDLAFALVNAGDVPAGDPHARAALRHAEMIGEPGLLAEALAVVAVVGCLLGRGVDDDAIERAVRLEDPGRPTPHHFRPSVIRAFLAIWTERLEEADEMLEQLRTRLIEAGEDSAVPFFTYQRVSVACMRGDLDRADRQAEEALEISSLVASDVLRAIALSAAAMVAAYRGRAGECRQQAGEAAEIFERTGWRLGTFWPLAALGLLELSLGDHAAVDRAVGQLADAAASFGLGEPLSAPFVAEATEAMIALGERVRAAAILDVLEQRGQALGRTWPLVVAARGRALTLAAGGSTEASLRAAADAVEMQRELDMPFEFARTLLVVGQVERRAKRWGPARASLERSAAMFRDLGAPLWERRAQEQLDRIGGRRPATAALTATERDVAGLVASGLSNRQVANALFLSPKTVAGTLTKVYRKLDVRSRSELAWRMANAVSPGMPHGSDSASASGSGSGSGSG